jgi:orotidine-5'-phosphate decarboxylase
VSGAPAPSGAFLDRLRSRVATHPTHLCVGIDPDPGALPDGFTRDLAGVEAFARLLIDAATEHAVAVKVNLAFFEAWGSDGIACLERLRGAVPPELVFVADAKRGDIGSTSERHAAALFDRLDAHAVTVSPYLGLDAIAPLVSRRDRFVYVLCRTSNPGAGELQDLIVEADGEVPAEALHRRVARRARTWDAELGTVGLVVGATAPEELRAIREVAPQLPFLVPGVGAQGGDVDAVVALAQATSGRWADVPGGGALVNVSRGIATAARRGGDPGHQLREAARQWSGRLAVLR